MRSRNIFSRSCRLRGRETLSLEAAAFAVEERLSLEDVACTVGKRLLSKQPLARSRNDFRSKLPLTRSRNIFSRSCRLRGRETLSLEAAAFAVEERLSLEDVACTVGKRLLSKQPLARSRNDFRSKLPLTRSRNIFSRSCRLRGRETLSLEAAACAVEKRLLSKMSFMWSRNGFFSKPPLARVVGMQETHSPAAALGAECGTEYRRARAPAARGATGSGCGRGRWWGGLRFRRQWRRAGTRRGRGR